MTCTHPIKCIRAKFTNGILYNTIIHEWDFVRFCISEEEDDEEGVRLISFGIFKLLFHVFARTPVGVPQVFFMNFAGKVKDLARPK